MQNTFLVAGDDGSSALHFFLNGAHTSNASCNIPSTPVTPGNIRALFFHDHVSGYAVTDVGQVFRTVADLTAAQAGFAWHAEPLGTDDDLDAQTNNALMDIRTIGFSDRHRGFMGGCYDCANNNTSPPVRYARIVHDESGLYSSRFWYDKLGRLVLSQNTRQCEADPKQYSYSLYDALGRVVEAGQVADGTGTVHDIFGAYAQDQWQPLLIDAGNLRTWVAAQANSNRTEVVRTFYDQPLDAGIEARFTTTTQDHLRLRVAATIFQEVYDPDPQEVDPLVVGQCHATHYSYDIHGNVKELLQHHPQLGADVGDPDGAWKHLRYRYDLISGNVLQVDYQDGQPDQFHHRYAYDADNRIERVETSRNALLWREDARYFYYPHGPLQRVEIGDNKVQGVDYAYTLQGWLKGINSALLTPGNDMGQDAAYTVGGNLNALIGRDVFGLTLGYYGDNDYAAIDPARWNTVADRPFAPVGTTGTLAGGHQPLYNGNIAHTTNTLAPFAGYPSSAVAPGQVLAMVYEYDQLNRLKQARGVVGLTTGNDWDGITDATTNRYKSEYWYDANGNIDTLARFDNDGNQYDGLGYRYQLNANDQKVRNRLYHVRELADAGDLYANDVNDLPYLNTEIADPYDAQQINDDNNYGYDALGNLVRDDNEGITQIDWTVAGKVKRVERTAASGKQRLAFGYGADGQRIAKTLENENGDPTQRTHYIRDAQGNIMATYSHNVATGSLKVKERPIYGSSRVGVDVLEQELAGSPPYEELSDPVGLVNYELSDHLGNVTTVVTDELLGVDVNSDTQYDYFQPYILSAQSYEPFGGGLPGRVWDRRQGAPVLRLLRMLQSGEDVEMDLNGTPVVLASYNSGYTTIAEYLADILTELVNNSITASIVDEEIRIQDWPANSKLTSADDLASLNVSSYRFGFQGQEKDDEIHGASGTMLAFEYRMHDARIGRFLSIDPLAAQYPYMTPYQFAGNKPIWSREIEGLESEVDRMDASFNRYPQGQRGQDWDYIEGNTYLNQQNSQGAMPGNFFYSTRLGRQNGVGTSYYRQITINIVATNSSTNTTTATGAPTTTTATVDGGGLGFNSWTATPTSPAAAAATLAGVAAAAPNGPTTTVGVPTTTSSSTTTQTRAPLVTTTTTVTTAVTVQTNVVSNVQSNITLNYATMGPFTPVGGGPGGIGSSGLLAARFAFVQSGLVGLGIPAGQISLGTATWGAPSSATGGALNRFGFGITLNTTNTGTTTTTTTTTTNTSLRFTGYTD